MFVTTGTNVLSPLGGSLYGTWTRLERKQNVTCFFVSVRGSLAYHTDVAGKGEKRRRKRDPPPLP